MSRRLLQLRPLGWTHQTPDRVEKACALPGVPPAPAFRGHPCLITGHGPHCPDPTGSFLRRCPMPFADALRNRPNRHGAAPARRLALKIPATGNWRPQGAFRSPFPYSP